MRGLILFFCFLSCAWAESPVSLKVSDIPLSLLVRLIHEEVQPVNFSLGSELMKEKVSVNLVDVKPEMLVNVINDLVKDYGYVAEEGNGLLGYRKAGEGPGEMIVYQPRFRSAEWLAGAAESFFGGRVKHTIKQMTKTKKTDKDDQEGAEFVIFKGTSREVERLEKLLGQLDVSPGEVMVKAVVYEVNSTSSDGSAVNLALNLLQGHLGVILGNGKNLENRVTLRNNTIEMIASVLSSDSRFRVVTSPQLRVKNGSAARLMVGSEVPVLGAVTMNQGGTSQSVDYKSSGVIFQLTPTIHDSLVDVALNAQISNFIPTTTGVNSSPTLTKRELQTQLLMAGDDVVVIGGLDQNQTNDESSGVSFLPSFLKSTGQQKTKTEIVLMLQLQRI